MFLERFQQLSIPKKIATIISCLFLLGSLLFFIIQYLNKPSTTKEQKEVNFPTKTVSPTAPIKIYFPSRISNQPQLITQENVFFPVLQNDRIFYASISEDRVSFYKISLNGDNKQLISTVQIPHPKQVVWSPDKTAVIISSGKGDAIFSLDPSSLRNSYFNFDSQKLKIFDPFIPSFSFSSNGKTLAYILPQETPEGFEPALYTSLPDGSSPNKIGVFPEGQNTVAFLDNESILSFSQPDPFVRDIPFYITNVTTKNMTKFPTDGHIFGVKISPDKRFFLSQRVDTASVPFVPYVVLMDPDKKKVVDLKLSARLDKTAWGPDGKTTYAIFGKNLIVIDVFSLEKRIIGLPQNIEENKIDSNSIMVYPDSKGLFYTSSNKLYNLPF